MYFTKVTTKGQLAKLGRNVATFGHTGTPEQSLESAVLLIHNLSERVKLFISLKENYYFLWLQGTGELPLLLNKMSTMIFITCM